MSDIETSDLSIVTGPLSGLPAPVTTSFLKAMGNLLGGLTAIPAAKLKQHAQGIEDTTAARSTVAAMVAKSIGERALTDPILAQAAAEIYLPTALRKAGNRIGVAQKTAEHIANKAGEHPDAAPPDQDWMNFYSRFAEDASSEALQDLFGRILAGQIVRPGSFSQATIRAVAELDQAIAADFSLVWAKSVGDAIDHDADFHLGGWFARWKRLAEAGLMGPSGEAQYLPPFSPVHDGNALWMPMEADGSWLLVHFPKGCGAKWQYIPFTRVGREIGSILPRPDYETNMRRIGHKIAQQGVARVELHSVNAPAELIFMQPCNQS